MTSPRELAINDQMARENALTTASMARSMHEAFRAVGFSEDQAYRFTLAWYRANAEASRDIEVSRVLTLMFGDEDVDGSSL